MVQQRKTIREAALLWTDDKRQYVKRSTISAYLLILENHINPEFGDEYGLKEEDIQDFAMKKLRKGLSRPLPHRKRHPQPRGPGTYGPEEDHGLPHVALHLQEPRHLHLPVHRIEDRGDMCPYLVRHRH